MASATPLELRGKARQGNPRRRRCRALATLGADGSQPPTTLCAHRQHTDRGSVRDCHHRSVSAAGPRRTPRALFLRKERAARRPCVCIKITTRLKSSARKQGDDLESIRRIRNEFQQAPPVASSALPPPEIAAQCKEPHVVDTLEFSRLDLAGPRNRYLLCSNHRPETSPRFELWFSGSTHR